MNPPRVLACPNRATGWEFRGRRSPREWIEDRSRAFSLGFDSSIGRDEGAATRFYPIKRLLSRPLDVGLASQVVLKFSKAFFNYRFDCFAHTCEQFRHGNQEQNFVAEGDE